jgi:tetratricopeptide (TPR) repeat protein
MRASALLLALAPALVAPSRPAAAQPERPSERAARARPAPHRPLPGKTGQDFWSWLLDPHEAEVKLILRKVAENRSRASSIEVLPYDYGAQFSPARAELRAELLADAEGMLRYALQLAPDNLDLERELALVTDDNDRPSAQAALERYLADEAAERASPEARVRLARWYARQRRFDDAVAQLRLALGGRPEYRTRTQAVLLLSSVLMHTGHLSDAIDLLRGHVASAGFGYYGWEPLTLFALAVAYDRDEQITQAHDVLTRIVSQGNGNDQLMNVLHDGNIPPNRNPLLPPIERHYFAALQYEALGFLPEARAEWQAYARDQDAPYRERAAAHIARIDHLLDAHRATSRPRPAPPPARRGGRP